MLELPERHQKEKQWFASDYLALRGITKNQYEEGIMSKFQDIIWNKPCREIIMNYGNTADEMAVLCSRGTGWLAFVQPYLLVVGKSNHFTGGSYLPLPTRARSRGVATALSYKTGPNQDLIFCNKYRSTNKEDEDEGDVGVETDDESDVNFDVEEGEVDGLRLDSSDDDESECRSRSSPSPTAEIVLSIFFNIP
ncbi:hypothetical protein PoB_004596800 [Plakobranchus ocellatus]|uniref:Uncharacterized protein n=1 Tax=Plakobranchus ocellatus TaxID=259542 RepID=A0AAV4BIS4_9GAST|nr:hypothetical protein PoB_004596800 [Plakobranchus ocellatus]